MGKRVPSEYKLFCIVAKGYHNTWSHYTPLLQFLPLILPHLRSRLQSLPQKNLHKENPAAEKDSTDIFPDDFFRFLQAL